MKVLIQLWCAGKKLLLPPEIDEELVATRMLLHECVLLLRCVCAFLFVICDVSSG